MRTRYAWIAVAILLLTVSLAASDPVAGNPQAKVRVVMYQDLECPYCAALHAELMKTIIPEFGARVAFEFRDFPIPGHAWSYNAAVLARFMDDKSAQLGLAWRDYCFQHQEDITPGNLMDTATRFCANAGITRAQLTQAMSRQDLYARIAADQAMANRDHVAGTPTLFVQGILMPLSNDGVAATATALSNAIKGALASAH